MEATQEILESIYCGLFNFPTNRMYVCMVITYSKSMDQPGKGANPARGQLNREK